MRTLCLCLVVFALPALAHIKLTSPGSFQVTNTLGDPQKTGPCGGAGTASGVVTTVEAGSQLTVSWRETILHPGHFRIGIATNASQFVTPSATVTNNNCVSAPIESPVAAPTLVDGLFAHTTAAPNGTYSTTVTVPMVACDNCQLQLLQFMSSHTPPCFYFQCATLRIVLPDAGSTGGGGGGATGGGNGSDAGSMGGGAGGGGGAAMNDAGASGGGSATGGGTGTPTECNAANCSGCCVGARCETGSAETACGVGGALCAQCASDTTCESGSCTSTPRGCGCGSGAPPALALMALLGLAFWVSQRRRAR